MQVNDRVLAHASTSSDNGSTAVLVPSHISHWAARGLRSISCFPMRKLACSQMLLPLPVIKAADPATPGILAMVPAKDVMQLI